MRNENGKQFLTDEEYAVVDKITKKSGMDSWFLLKLTDDGDQVYDLENLEEMTLEEGISYIDSGLSDLGDYELTAEEIHIYEALLVELGIQHKKEERALKIRLGTWMPFRPDSRDGEEAIRHAQQTKQLFEEIQQLIKDAEKKTNRCYDSLVDHLYDEYMPKITEESKAVAEACIYLYRIPTAALLNRWRLLKESFE